MNLSEVITLQHENLVKKLPLHVHGYGNQNIFCASFSASQFECSMFESDDIEYPRSISMSVSKRQAEFFFGRICAKLALRELDIRNMQVKVGEFGAPIWPPGFTGSITHTNTLAAAIVVPIHSCSGIGIDIENVIDKQTTASISQTVLTGFEFAYLQTNVTIYPLEVLLTIVFSAKESFFKAVFSEVRHYFDFNAISIYNIDPEKKLLQFVINETLSQRFQVGTCIEISFDFMSERRVITACAW